MEHLKQIFFPNLIKLAGWKHLLEPRNNGYFKLLTTYINALKIEF